MIELFRSRKQTPQQPEALEYRENEPAIKSNEDLLGKLMLRQLLKMAQKSLPALKASEESFEDFNADGDFEASDSNSASSSDNEETASVDGSQGNKVKILPSIINIDGKQYVEINNNKYVKSSIMAPKSLPALKASEESFDDSGADVDFESSDSNSASSIDDEEIASIDRSEGNKTNILPSIIEIDGKQCVKINNKTYLL